MVAEVQTSLPPLDMTPILYPSEMIFPECVSLSGGVTKMARGTWRQVLQTVWGGSTAAELFEHDSQMKWDGLSSCLP